MLHPGCCRDGLGGEVDHVIGVAVKTEAVLAEDLSDCGDGVKQTVCMGGSLFHTPFFSQNYMTQSTATTKVSKTCSCFNAGRQEKSQ